MKTVSRRSVIKGMARAGIFGAAASLAPAIIGCRRRQIHLNVVLHGLFVLNALRDKIELLTPYTCEHIYKVGPWNYDDVKSLERHECYELQGTVKAEVPPLFSRDCSLALTNPPFKFGVDYKSCYCKVTLPFPKEIHYLRCVNEGENIYDYKNNSIVLRKFALCQVLVYSVNDSFDLNLTHSAWKPEVDWDTNTVNLHFWAEPEGKLTAAHADAAYQTFSDLTYPLKIGLGTTNSAPLDEFTGVTGLSREEEQGWSEWIDGGETSHPTNCNVATLDQTGQSTIPAISKIRASKDMA